MVHGPTASPSMTPPFRSSRRKGTYSPRIYTAIYGYLRLFTAISVNFREFPPTLKQTHRSHIPFTLIPQLLVENLLVLTWARHTAVSEFGRMIVWRSLPMTFNETRRLIVDAAKSQAAMNAHNTVFEAKRKKVDTLNINRP